MAGNERTPQVGPKAAPAREIVGKCAACGEMIYGDVPSFLDVDRKRYHVVMPEWKRCAPAPPPARVRCPHDGCPPQGCFNSGPFSTPSAAPGTPPASEVGYYRDGKWTPLKAAPEQAGMREARLEAAARALLDATDRADSADAIARGLKALRAALASDSTERR